MSGSFKMDILPLFNPGDIDCMEAYDVHLDSFEWMSNPDHAKNVYLRLTGKRTPRMPQGGPYWDKDMLQKFNDWMTVDPKFQP